MHARLSRRPVRSIAPLAAAALVVAVAAATPAAAAKKPTSVKASAGAVSAKVSYTPGNRAKYLDYRHLRLTVTGPTGALTKVRLPKNSSSSTRPFLRLVDLNGDGIPDPLIDTFTGGAHCCSISSMALSTPTGWGAPITQFWGDYGYELKYIDNATAPVFQSADDRFAYAYSAYAASIPALQIWSATSGAMVDVTRQYPNLLRADAASISDYWNEAVKSAQDDPVYVEAVQSVTAAWVADLSLLGDYAAAKAVLDKTAAGGSLKGGDDTFWQNAKSFPGQLAHDLKAWGYLADPTLVGLPAA